LSSNKSRILVLICGSLACVTLDYWLVTTGHYRLPLFLFVAFVLAITLVFRKLRPPTRSPDEVHKGLLNASSGFRRLGFIGAFGIVVYILTSSRDDFRGIATWGIVLIYLWGAFIVWCYFWAARSYRRKANASSLITKQREDE